MLGLVTDPALCRDSCGSTKFGKRLLWTARDTQPFGPDGRPVFPIFSSSASWSDFNDDGTPKLIPVTADDSSKAKVHAISNPGPYQLLMYGDNHNQPFFPILADNSNSAGGLPDGTRFAIWPDSPPLVADENGSPDGNGTVVGYTWIKKARITSDLKDLVENPATTLYRITYNPERDGEENLPLVEVVDEEFWTENAIPYGVYGNVVRNGIAYLWGQTSNKTTSLAKVPVSAIEDKSQYQYLVNGEWVNTEPSPGEHQKNPQSLHIPHVSAGGQGTFYFSPVWDCYVWIGQGHPSVSAEFYITTAPEPEGPWIEPQKFYVGENGTFFLGAYSLQAHPGLVREGENAVYLTYTKNDVLGDGGGCVYSTPLIYVEWE